MSNAGGTSHAPTWPPWRLKSGCSTWRFLSSGTSRWSAPSRPC